jgi:hypothetical protein
MPLGLHQQLNNWNISANQLMMPKEAQQAHLASSLLTTKAHNFYNQIQNPIGFYF